MRNQKEYVHLQSRHDTIYQLDAPHAHWSVECPNCDASSMTALVQGDGTVGGRVNGWLVCFRCGAGAVAVKGNMEKILQCFPSSRPLGTPDHLPGEVEGTWHEALDTYSVSAFTSSVLMCRKIIFHMAVEEGLPAQNEKGYAPNFNTCVDHLVQKEVLSQRQKDEWADSVRVWGNQATHELPQIEKEVALNALHFTYQLLMISYQFPMQARDFEVE